MSINPRAQVAPALATLPKPITLRSMRKSAQPITLQYTQTGMLFYRGTNLVAWLVSGKHSGQSDGQPKQCRFYDVAYYRLTQKGFNLETSDHLTLQEAFNFTLGVISNPVEVECSEGTIDLSLFEQQLRASSGDFEKLITDQQAQARVNSAGGVQ